MNLNNSVPIFGKIKIAKGKQLSEKKEILSTVIESEQINITITEVYKIVGKLHI